MINEFEIHFHHMDGTKAFFTILSLDVPVVCAAPIKEEKKILITEKDIGKRAKKRDYSIVYIIGIVPEIFREFVASDSWVLTVDKFMEFEHFNIDGTFCSLDDALAYNDIIEVLED